MAGAASYLLADRQDIPAVPVGVVDIVHEFSDHKQAETADGSLLLGKLRRVRVLFGQGIMLTKFVTVLTWSTVAFTVL